jgi:hypothetical protein
MSRSTLALLPALLLACDLIGSPTIDLVVSTEHSSYEASSLQTLVPIRLVLENKGRATLEIGRCGERLAAYVDRRIGPNWKQILQSGLVCQAAFDMSPLRLAPGNTVITVPILVASGRYRFRVPYSRVGERAHARLATSNEAIVTPAP